MSSVNSKQVLVGVSGGIAAYKSADLVRRLRDAGADVRVAMTGGAEAFITPLTMQAVSGRPVAVRFLDAEAESGMSHIELARWTDVVLIAPASANLLARLAHGLADDLLTTVCLATQAPIAVAPAMNQQMWQHAATRHNVDLLIERGVHVFGPAKGSQACGETGPGRMLEPAELTSLLGDLFQSDALAGVKVMITAGPTREAIDPVRSLTNRSSGKMGYAVAQAAAEVGAEVLLISGPTHLPAPRGVARVSVNSALEMHEEVMCAVGDVDIFIGVAAVADYRPLDPSAKKVKKSAERLTIELIKNPDILASVAARINAPYTVGFAAETHNVETHAREKLLQKGVDMIAANHVGTADGGFDTNNNALTVIDREQTKPLPRMSKLRLARALVDEIALRYRAKCTTKNPGLAHR